MNKLVFIDTETGGLNPQYHSLLSVGLVGWEDGEILKETEVFIEYVGYNVTKEAKKINGFDMEIHELKAIKPLDAILKIACFCTNHFDKSSDIVLAGHNTQFDVSFVKELFKQLGVSYNKYFSHRIVDTHSILMALQHAQVIKKPIRNSDEAFDYFNITVDGRHTAIGDARATAELYNKLLELM